MRVLFVHLDSAICNVFRSALESADITLGETHDTAQALRVLAGSSQPVVVVLDLHQSAAWDGVDLLNAIADNPTLATGHRFLTLRDLNGTMPPTLSRAMPRLPITFVAKPTNDADLRRVIKIAFHQMQSSLGYESPAVLPLLDPADLSWAYA
jgi:CheY-like chemotaxis protein